MRMTRCAALAVVGLACAVGKMGEGQSCATCHKGM